MRVVVDTNVIVSALLKPGSIPAQALDALLARATLLVDERILLEYRTVTGRPKFRKVDPDARAALLARIDERAVVLDRVARYDGALADDDDRRFVEVALAGAASAIVTGNLADYPTHLGFEVVPPATALLNLP